MSKLRPGDQLGCCLCNKYASCKGLRRSHAFKNLVYKDGILYNNGVEGLEALGPFDEVKNKQYNHAPKPTMEVHYKCFCALPAAIVIAEKRKQRKISEAAAASMEVQQQVENSEAADAHVGVKLHLPAAASSPLKTRCRQAERQQLQELRMQVQQLQEVVQQHEDRRQELKQLQEHRQQEIKQLQEKLQEAEALRAHLEGIAFYVQTTWGVQPDKERRQLSRVAEKLKRHAQSKENVQKKKQRLQEKQQEKKKLVAVQTEAELTVAQQEARMWTSEAATAQRQVAVLQEQVLALMADGTAALGTVYDDSTDDDDSDPEYLPETEGTTKPHTAAAVQVEMPVSRRDGRSVDPDKLTALCRIITKYRLSANSAVDLLGSLLTGIAPEDLKKQLQLPSVSTVDAAMRRYCNSAVTALDPTAEQTEHIADIADSE